MGLPGHFCRSGRNPPRLGVVGGVPLKQHGEALSGPYPHGVHLLRRVPRQSPLHSLQVCQQHLVHTGTPRNWKLKA